MINNYNYYFKLFKINTYLNTNKKKINKFITNKKKF